MSAAEIGGLRDELDALLPHEEPEEPGEDEQLLEEVRSEARAFLGLDAQASLEEIQDGFREDLWAFWTFFLPHYRQREDGSESEGADYQREFLEATQNLVLGRRGKQLARAYPREHAKSVLGSFTTTLWASAHAHRRFTFIFSDTDTQAWGFLEDLRLELETNERLAAVYPELCQFQGKPRVNRLVLGNDVVIMAAGSGKSVRGARKRAQRPDFIILDDIENDEETENPARRRKKVVWYNKVVKKLGRSSVYLIVGTILHAESFLAQQVQSEADINAAVVRDADRQDLWQQWEEILRDRARPDREAAARAFYEANRAEMDRGAEVLWPGKFSLYELYLERAEDLASYLSERQNKPFDPSASWFPQDGIVWVPREELPAADDVVLSVGFWDPSRGTSKGDTSGTLRLDVRRDGRRTVSWGVAERMKPEEVMEIAIGQHKLRAFGAFGVEKVGLSSYDEQLQALAQANQVGLPVVPVTPVGNKVLRIKSLRPLIVARALEFSEELPLEAKRQINFFPNYPNDDFPDAVQQAVQLADLYLQDVKAAASSIDTDPAATRLDAETAFGRERLAGDAAPWRGLDDRFSTPSPSLQGRA